MGAGHAGARGRAGEDRLQPDVRRRDRLAWLAKASRAPLPRLRSLIALFAGLLGGEARAGPWIKDEAETISTAVAGVRDGLSFSESELFIEAPSPNRRWALTAQPRVDTGYEYADGWRAEGGLALKRRLYEKDGATLATQAGPIWTSDPAAGCGEAGAEARLLGGRGFKKGFLATETAYRAQDGGCAHARLDLTIGRAFGPRYMGLGQVFADRNLDHGDTVKLQLTLVRFNEKGAGLQIGFRTRLDPDGREERAIVIGRWSAPNKNVAD